MRTRKTSWGRAAALFAALLVLGAGLAGCDTGGGGEGDGGTGPVTGGTTEYKAVYTLATGENLTVSRPGITKAATTVTITPQAGDTYTLKLGTLTISTGKIRGSGTLTFYGTGLVTTFQATVSGNGLLTIKTAITYTANGSTKTIAANSTNLEGAWKVDNDISGGRLVTTSYIFVFSGNNFWTERTYRLLTSPPNSPPTEWEWTKGTFTADDSMLFLTLTQQWYTTRNDSTWQPTSETASWSYSINGDALTFYSPALPPPNKLSLTRTSDVPTPPQG